MLCKLLLHILLILPFLSLIIESKETDSPKSVLTCAKSGTIYGGEVVPSEQLYKKCEKETNHCYAFWREDPNNGSIIVMGQGNN